MDGQWKVMPWTSGAMSCPDAAAVNKSGNHKEGHCAQQELLSFTPPPEWLALT